MLPQSAWDQLARLGPIWASNVSGHVQQMVDLFSAIHKGAPDDGVQVTRDLAYGPHARQCLDVFRLPDRHQRPVVVFVHGGAFVSGHRNRSGQIYANVLRYFARHDYVGVNIEYRLAPEACYPQGSEDVANAVAWVRRHIAGYGGDPTAIFLACHSAGAAHVCGYLFDPQVKRSETPDVRGLMVISGRVRADADADNPNAAKVRAYYGDDVSLYAQRSPVNHASATPCPVFIAFAEYENPLIDVYCLELAYQIAIECRRAPEVIQMTRHNHTSIIGHINTTEDELGKRMRLFIDRHTVRAD